LADFGLSCFVDECVKTRSGTLAYLSPRILFGLLSKNDIEWYPFDDIYAIALVVYECLMYDVFFDPEEIRQELNTPNLTNEEFIQFMKQIYNKNLLNLNEWKLEIGKICPFEISEKLNKIVSFIKLFLNPENKDWKVSDTNSVKSILKL
jgi:serine/threonine protein kinase